MDLNPKMYLPDAINIAQTTSIRRFIRQQVSFEDKIIKKEPFFHRFNDNNVKF